MEKRELVTFQIGLLEIVETSGGQDAMEAMPLSPSWGDLSLRLALAALAGALIGLNRGEHGHPAGLRTTLLVGLAAAITMVEVNLLLKMGGKTPDSFITIDPMRLPLGLLSGMGFIGAGAILRRGEMVHGVTTAATLWITTVIGLCFGGGQLILGSIAVTLTLIILWGLKRIELYMPREQHASLCVTVEAEQPPIALLDRRLVQVGFKSSMEALELEENGRRQVTFEIQWNGRSIDSRIPGLLADLSRTAGVAALKWTTRGAPPA